MYLPSNNAYKSNLTVYPTLTGIILGVGEVRHVGVGGLWDMHPRTRMITTSTLRIFICKIWIIIKIINNKGTWSREINLMNLKLWKILFLCLIAKERSSVFSFVVVKWIWHSKVAGNFWVNCPNSKVPVPKNKEIIIVNYGNCSILIFQEKTILFILT